MKLKFKMNKRGTVAISQIALLIVSLFAITFLISLSMPTVKAEGVASSCSGTCLMNSGGVGCPSGTSSVVGGTCTGGASCCQSTSGSNGGGNFLSQYVFPTAGSLAMTELWNLGKKTLSSSKVPVSGKAAGDIAAGSVQSGVASLASLTFPTSPVVGDILVDEGVGTWVYGGSGWELFSDSGVSSGFIVPASSSVSSGVVATSLSTLVFPVAPAMGATVADAGVGTWVFNGAGWELFDTWGISTGYIAPATAGTFWNGMGVVFGAKGAATGFAMNAGAIFGNFLAAAAAVALVHYGLQALGFSERNVRGSTVTAIIAGGASAVIGSILVLAGASATVPVIGWIVAGVTILAAGVWLLGWGKNYSIETFSYVASLWQPVDGGQNCEKCNKLDSGCNEYQCHTFGAACELINEGTGKEVCIWNNTGLASPEIQPMEKVLKPNYAYTPLEVNLPSDRGVKIVYSGQYSDDSQCVLPFTSLTLGVNTSQPAQCRIDVQRKQNFSALIMPMAEGSVYTYEHIFFLPSSSLLSKDSMDAVNMSLKNGNDYSYFIRCKNYNGIESAMQFEMQFCVQDGPDPTAPEILYTNIFNDSACVLSDKTTNPLEVYTNEPADCRWDFNNVNYDDMFYPMNCSQTVADNYPVNSMTYGCTGTLEGIQKAQENKYYLKCKDQPWLEGKEDTSLAKRNVNEDPYVVVLQGSQPLVITDLTINDKGNNINIKDSTDTVPVTISVNTLAGCMDGNARCAHGEIRSGKVLYTDFYNEGSFDYMATNTETLHLPAGSYSIPIKCIDEGGNDAYTQANFTIESDLTSPVITRAYYEDNYLKLITDEKASCVYGDESTGCTFQFEDGSAISTRDGIEHFTKWDTTASLFIRCKDQFGNMPSATTCNIIVRPYEKKA